MVTKPYERIEAAVVILYETFQYEKELILNLVPKISCHYKNFVLDKTKLTGMIIVNLIFFPHKFNHNGEKIEVLPFTVFQIIEQLSLANLLNTFLSFC